MDLLLTLGILCFAMTVALMFVLVIRVFSGGQDWSEADDWFDRDEHDMVFLEDGFEE